MQCDICFRTGGSRLPFLCPTDARNRLYEPRIQNARVLLEKDALDRQISNLLSPQVQFTGEKGNSLQGPASGPYCASILAEREQTVDRTQQIITQADELRAKVESARQEIAKKKALIASRKSDLASALNGVDSRRTKQVEDVEKGLRMTKYKWNQAHTTTAASRAFLCGEAAKLYGLKRARRNSGSEEYRIGGVNIVDLRTMNSKSSHFVGDNNEPVPVASSPAQISTALSHIVHLLMLSTHYLAVRLPAEITLPHRDYPLPTIFNLTSSYKHGDVPFPGISGQSSNTSPTASRQPEQPNQPRPRPLFIKKPLPLLATEDPSGYGLFLEGVTLLAYDVAWLCKSQGIPVGEDKEPSFQDICNIGKNLYNLLLGSRSRPVPTSRVPSAQSTPTKSTRDTETEPEDRKNVPAVTMGQYSHGSAHSFLGSAEGTYFVRSWKLPNPIKLAGELKLKLLSEVANAEWEVLDEDAWQVDDEMGDDGVVVGARKEVDKAPNLGMQSFMSMRTVMEAVETVGGDGARKPGTNGWTKLKPR
jgi:Vacuolar sorting 38 and autophagy-related subunit 14